MPVQKEIRKKANIYFFSKVVFNALLIVLGAVLIALFLRQMQHKTALTKQRENSEQALTEAVSILEKNAEDAEELTRVFHDGNQDMLDDLKELLQSGLFDSLATAGRLAAARGYHLAATAGMQPLSDDALDSVAGGFDPARLQAEQEINPYSWFVTILRRLMGEDGEEELL
jgi:hypothetical protein